MKKKKHMKPGVFAMVVGLMGSGMAYAADPAQPWPGPKASWVFAEAEMFDAEGTAWAVKDTPYHSRAIIASNMKYLSGDSASAGQAHKVLDVGEDGEYKLWVNFRQPAVSKGAFEVVISQGGKEVLRQKFDNGRDEASEEDIAGNGGNDSDKRVQFGWGEAKGMAKLNKGEVKITLIKPGEGKKAETGQMVDCVLLTKDPTYKPDYRDFVPQTYIRLRLLKSDLPKTYFYGFADHMRPPWYGNLGIGKGVINQGVTVKEKDLLTPGDDTGWLNFTRQLYIDSDTNLMLMATYKYHNPDAKESAYAIDVASAPDEKSIVSTFERSGPGAGMHVRFRPNLADGKKPLFDLDVAKENLRITQAIPQPAFGKRPTKFPVFIAMNATDMRNSFGVYETEMKVLELLGLSGRKDSELDENDIAHGLVFGRTGVRVMLFGPGGFDEPLWDRIKGFVKRGGEETTKSPLNPHVLAVQLTDEAGPPDLAAIVGKPIHEKAFVEWLKETGQTPEKLGVKTWDQVKMTSDRGAQNPVLYAMSQRYRAWMIVKFFKECTKLVRAEFPAHMKAHQNFSDGAVYHANLYSQGNDYFTWFRNEGLDIAWSEDWTNIGSSPQLTGWNVALLRAATREHKQPIGMYVIASGRSPMDVKLKAYSNMAQGSKFLEMFSYTPTYTGHETSWYMHPGTYQAVMELNREIGAAEDVLMDAMPRRAQTAILYSRAYDLWNVGFDNAAGHDRMHTYMALRHANVAVDVVDEEDVVAGDLKDRKVVYLSGEQLDARVVPVLVQWVKDGGTLVLAAGAGTRDEFNRETNALDKGLGIERGPLQRLQGYWHASAYRVAKNLLPQGKVQWRLTKPYGGYAEQSVDFFAQKQDIISWQGGKGSPASDMKFADGKPARQRVALINGFVEVYGFLPGLSYIMDAQAAFDKNGQEPAPKDATLLRATGEKTRARYSNAPDAGSFNGELRSMMNFHSGKLAKEPVTVSSPLVEATLLEGTVGWVVPLANYSGDPVREAVVRIHVGNRKFGKVYSSRQGELKVIQDGADGTIVVRLPLDSTDMIFAKWE